MALCFHHGGASCVWKYICFQNLKIIIEKKLLKMPNKRWQSDQKFLWATCIRYFATHFEISGIGAKMIQNITRGLQPATLSGWKKSIQQKKPKSNPSQKKRNYLHVDVWQSNLLSRTSLMSKSIPRGASSSLRCLKDSLHVAKFRTKMCISIWGLKNTVFLPLIYFRKVIDTYPYFLIS